MWAEDFHSFQCFQLLLLLRELAKTFLEIFLYFQQDDLIILIVLIVLLEKTKNNHIPGLLVTTKFYYNRLLGVLFQSVFISCSCSHPAVGKVGEALLHQDGFQHIRIHHSQHGFPELIHTEHLHRTHLHFGRYLSWKIFLIAEGTLAPVVLTKTKK